MKVSYIVPTEETCEACTIIICTLGLADRKASLNRAIRSLQNSNRATVEILIVVNGDRFDSHLVDGLKCRQDISVLQIETGSLAAAILAGRNSVSTPFFGFLDDDDEYLPGAVDSRLSVMFSNSGVGVVITNGYRQINGMDTLALSGLDAVEQDPLSSLLEGNWLASCGGMYRTSDVSVELFENISSYLEWTWVAFRLSLSAKKIVALDTPTFRIHDTPVSESKSDAYRLNRVVVLQRMKSESLNGDIRSKLDSKIAQTWHDISFEYLQRGQRYDALLAHIQSLRTIKSFKKYLFYSRHLLKMRKN